MNLLYNHDLKDGVARMSASRRAFLQAMSFFALQGSGFRHGGVFAAVLGPANGQGDVLPASHPEDAVSFGIDAERHFLDHKSYYAVPATVSQQNRLCFDVSNNRISCSVNARGLLERLVTQVGVTPNEARATPAGAYVDKVLYRAGPFPVTVSVGGAPAVRLDELQQPEVHLEDNLLPRYEWTLGPWKLRMLVFAPQTEARRPPVICTRWTVHSADKADTSAIKLFLDANGAASTGHTEQAQVQSLVWQSGSGWSGTAAETAIDIPSGDAPPTTLAILLATNPQEAASARAELTSSSAPSWLAATREYHRSRYGTLSLPADPFYAELYVRAAELSRQSLMLDTQSRFGGSFNGSDLPAATNVWMRDCFYSALPQCFLSPELSRAAIFFFLQWSIPGRPLGDHAERFPGATGVTNSLGNSVAGIVLAGAHYANNGDREFFLQHRKILTRSVEILHLVLASRREEAFLFPSIYVSDGEARGDFHTGSNLFLWRAFSSVARLADEIYAEADLAAMWRGHAARLREAILSNCVATEDNGRRFVEGAMQDHTHIAGHDAEESDVTLASFYDFCEADDEAYLNAAREAISPSNPYTIKEVEGVWWYAHWKWSSATFPGWTTALASSRNEEELMRHLERIRTLTDADGSFWWWPYPHDLPPRPEHPLRTNSKCGWAAGVYVCFFTRHILGLSADMPNRRVSFRPFLPWPEFTWKNCRLGGIKFDCSYVRREAEITMTIRNRTAKPMEISFEAMVPQGARVLRTHGGEKTLESARVRRYGRDAAQYNVTVPGGMQAIYRVEFEQGTSS